MYALQRIFAMKSIVRSHGSKIRIDFYESIADKIIEYGLPEWKAPIFNFNLLFSFAISETSFYQKQFFNEIEIKIMFNIPDSCRELNYSVILFFFKQVNLQLQNFY